MTPGVGLVTYSTKPRGGVIHLLALAEALHARSFPVQIIALDQTGHGFFRPVAVPCRLVPAPAPAATLDQRVFAAVDALADGLRSIGDALPRVLHVQDCIAARAAVRIRDEGAAVSVVRTVHHVDDFTTPALVECQRRSILDPDRVLVVSRFWQERVSVDYGRDADVVTNGVDVERFAPRPAPEVISAMRARVGATDRFLVLTVGGIEPRKGTDHLFRALALLRQRLPHRPVLAIIGGHSFQDHAEYRQRVIDAMPGLDLQFNRDVVMLGTVPSDDVAAWYHATDAFAFPSVNEGWGLVVLEALAAGTAAVVSDLPVFREYLVFGRDVLAVAPGDDEGLATQLARLATDVALRAHLSTAGRHLAARYRWSTTAAQHLAIYAPMLAEEIAS